MNSRIVLLAAGLVCAPVLAPLATAASTPQINGTYAMTFIETCQTTISTSRATKKSPDISSVDTVNVGGLSGEIGVATFNAKAKTMSITGWQDKGDTLILSNLAGGQVMADSGPITQTFTFSNTSNSIKLTPTGKGQKAITLHILYGGVVSQLVHNAQFVGPTGQAGCYAFGTAVLQ